MKQITLEEIKTQLLVDDVNENDKLDALEGYDLLEYGCNLINYHGFNYSIEMYDNGCLQGYHNIIINIEGNHCIYFCYEDLYNMVRMSNVQSNVYTVLSMLIG